MHVMNGGRLYQHVDGHAISTTHQATVIGPSSLIIKFPKECGNIDVTSTHHQMMDDSCGEVVLAAWVSDFKEDGVGYVSDTMAYCWDVEAIWHPTTRSFCYQPHPEYLGKEHDCQKFYFMALRHLLFPKRNQELKEAS